MRVSRRQFGVGFEDDSLKNASPHPIILPPLFRFSKEQNEGELLPKTRNN